MAVLWTSHNYIIITRHNNTRSILILAANASSMDPTVTKIPYEKRKRAMLRTYSRQRNVDFDNNRTFPPPITRMIVVCIVRYRELLCQSEREWLMTIVPRCIVFSTNVQRQRELKWLFIECTRPAVVDLSLFAFRRCRWRRRSPWTVHAPRQLVQCSAKTMLLKCGN